LDSQKDTQYAQTETTSCDVKVPTCNISKEEMIAGKSTWNQCCEKSVKTANLVGRMRRLLTVELTIQDWLRLMGILRQAKKITNESMRFAPDFTFSFSVMIARVDTPRDV
jgi:hypothetical protein